MTDRHPTEELLVALALDDVTAEQRDEVLRHLSGCERCRRGYDAIAGTVDRTLPATPVVEPPPGFDAAVLAAFDGAVAIPGRNRRRALQLVAAVLAGILIGAAAAVLANGLTSQDPPDGRTANDPVGALTANSVPLRTGDGTTVGSVAASAAGEEPVMVVGVTRPDVGVELRCVLRLSDGRRVETEAWSARTADGWTWVLPVPERIAADVVGMELETAPGRVWSSATLALRPWQR